MDIETMAMLTWAMEHPYLYTVIKMKHAITVLGLFGIVKALSSVYVASKKK